MQRVFANYSVINRRRSKNKGAADSSASFICTNKSKIDILSDIVVVDGRVLRSRMRMQGGIKMSGAQMAHLLKQVGNGSELAGIGAVFHAGWIVGVG